MRSNDLTTPGTKDPVPHHKVSWPSGLSDQRLPGAEGPPEEKNSPPPSSGHSLVPVDLPVHVHEDATVLGSKDTRRYDDGALGQAFHTFSDGGGGQLSNFRGWAHLGRSGKFLDRIASHEMSSNN